MAAVYVSTRFAELYAVPAQRFSFYAISDGLLDLGQPCLGRERFHQHDVPAHAD